MLDEAGEADHQAVMQLLDGAEFKSTALIPRFYEEAILDQKATHGWTEEKYDPDTGSKIVKKHPGAGRPIYENVTFIEIRVAGNKDEIRRRAMRPSDQHRFAKAWEAFQKDKQSEGIGGTPLDVAVPLILTKAQVMEFRAIGLRTLENIRDMSDSNGQKILGFPNLKRRIGDYLAAMDGNAPVARLHSEIEQSNAENKALRERVEALEKAASEPKAKAK